jgi:hypothetical protein
MGNLYSSTLDVRRSSTSGLSAMSMVLKYEVGASCTQSGTELVCDALKKPEYWDLVIGHCLSKL